MLRRHGEPSELELAVERLHAHGAQVEAVLVEGEEMRDARVNASRTVKRGEAAASHLVE